MRRRDFLIGTSLATVTAPALAQPVPFAAGVFKKTLGPNGGSLGPVTGGTNPTIDLNFITGAASFTTGSFLDSRITFSRADVLANASYYDATGVLRYGPTNLAFPSNAPATLLTPTAVTLTAASGTAPDGTVTMARMAETATTAIHIASKSLTVIASTVYTFSLYAQAQQNAYLQLLYDDGTAGNGVYATFDLTNGIISGAVTARGTGSGAGASIQSVGGGIYRISVTGAIGALTTGRYSAIMSQNGTTFAQSYAGSTSNGLLIWGAQFEQATAPGPYTATTGAALSGPRFDYGPTPTGGVTNWLRNSVATGASGATPPTNWTAGSGNLGITVTNVGPSTDAQGLPAIDITLSGTASGTSALVGLQGFESATQIPAITGQTWTTACNLQLVSGTLNGLTIGVDVAERTIAGALVTVHSSSVSPTGTMTRYSSTATFSGGTTVAYVGPALRWSLTSGQTINVTIRVSQPQLEQAASAGTYVPTSGMALNSGATPKGLLIEEARTNLAFPSNAPATLFNVVAASTITAAQGVAPDGTTAMARLAEDATTATHYVSKSFTVTASAVYTFSLYAQAQQDTFLQLFYDDGTAVNGCYANFNLSTGAIAQAIAAVGAGTATAASIQAAGNGIYRCSITGVATSSTTGRCGVVLAQVFNAAFGTSFAGSTSNGLLIWGAQFELGSLPTTYIPTVSASVTRAVDNASLALSPPAAFSLAAEVMVPVVAGTQGFAEIDDGTIANRVTLRATSAVFNATSVASSAVTAAATSGAPTVNAVLKAACVSNGTASTITVAQTGVVATAVAGAQPTGLTTLRLGANQFNGVNLLDGWLRRVRYYPQALSSTQLVTVTT